MFGTKSTALAAIAASFFALAPSAGATDLLDARLDASADQPAGARVNWTGLWIGAAGGIAFSNSETDFDSVDEPGTKSLNVNIDGLGAEGLFGEAQIGYDQQISNNLVLGVFGGLNLSDSEFNASIANNGNLIDSFSTSTDYEWGGVAGLRLGLLKSQSTMFYVAGGLAYAELGNTLVDGETFASGPELNGWFGEAGMETRVADNVFFTVSGRYTDYGSETLFSQDCGNLGAGETCAFGSPLDDNINTIEIDTDNLAVMIGLKAKLGY